MDKPNPENKLNVPLASLLLRRPNGSLVIAHSLTQKDLDAYLEQGYTVVDSTETKRTPDASAA